MTTAQQGVTALSNRKGGARCTESGIKVALNAGLPDSPYRRGHSFHMVGAQNKRGIKTGHMCSTTVPELNSKHKNNMDLRRNYVTFGRGGGDIVEY